MERVVEFTSDGVRLRGVLHTPDTNPRNMGVVFLNAGLIYRTGPHRLYVKAARRLCSEGFACLRFDFPGVGDSEGAVKEIPDVDLFPDASPTDRAVEVLMREAEVQHVTLIGMCTGARNAVRTARKNSRIGSLILVSMPVTFDRTKTPTFRLMASQNMRNKTLIPALHQFARSTHVWKILVKGYLCLVTSSSFRRVRDVVREMGTVFNRRRAGDADHEDLIRACHRVLAGDTRVIFIYAEANHALVTDFQRNLGEKAIHQEGSGEPPYDHWVVKGAEHVFSGAQIQQALIDGIVDWLNAGIREEGFGEPEVARVGGPDALSIASD